MRFLLVFGILFFVELGGLIAFSESFGFLVLVAEIILSGILGVFLLLTTFSASNESIVEFLRNTRDPQEILASNLTKVFGAILLILPGILSDCLGLLLCFGILDSVFVSFLQKVRFSKRSRTYDREEVIDVEVIETHERIKDEKDHHWK